MLPPYISWHLAPLKLKLNTSKLQANAPLTQYFTTNIIRHWVSRSFLYHVLHTINSCGVFFIWRIWFLWIHTQNIEFNSITIWLQFFNKVLVCRCMHRKYSIKVNCTWKPREKITQNKGRYESIVFVKCFDCQIAWKFTVRRKKQAPNLICFWKGSLKRKVRERRRRRRSRSAKAGARKESYHKERSRKREREKKNQIEKVAHSNRSVNGFIFFLTT